MKIVVLDDYQDAFRTLSRFPRLAGHEVLVFHDAVKQPEALAARLGDAEAAVLIQQRSALPRAVRERLPGVKVLVSQTGRNVGHIDLAACTERGIVVSAGGASSPNATAELAWGLILAALRQIPQEAERLKAGLWLGSLGSWASRARRSAFTPSAGSAASSPRSGERSACASPCWGRAGLDGAGARGRVPPWRESREVFFATADVLSLHVPLSAETHGLVTADDLSAHEADGASRQYEPGAGHSERCARHRPSPRRPAPASAAVDVYEDEPVLGANHPLIGMRERALHAASRLCRA